MSEDRPLPFPSRFGIAGGKLIVSDFPQPARVGLYHIVKALHARNYVPSWNALIREIERIARLYPSDNYDPEFFRLMLMELPWPSVYVFCERLYTNFLTSTDYASLEEVRAYYENELNQLLAEEWMAYEFKEGIFFRPGRLHTQKVVPKAVHVLTAPELSEALTHFQKALGYFSVGPEADYPNVVKEAVAALEAATKSLFPGIKANDFRDILKKLEGTGEKQIPPTIVKAMLSVYEFRGAATGVAHGGATGGIVSPQVAELILSLIASCITFLADFRTTGEEQPPF